MIYLTKNQVRLTLGLDNWLGWDFPSEFQKDENPPLAVNLGVGFYFFLFALLM
jgi:hypothetical protein